MAKSDHKSEARLAKSKICQTRQLKVNRTHYLYRLKDDPVGGGRPIPWIQLKGYWLQQAGFDIYSSVTVKVMDGCLVLTVDKTVND